MILVRALLGYEWSFAGFGGTLHGGSSSQRVKPKEEVVEAVGTYLGAITTGHPHAVCSMFAPSLRHELERRGGAACARLYASAGVRPDAEAPGTVSLRVPAITAARVHLHGDRARIGRTRLSWNGYRWVIVAGPPDKVANRLLGQRIGGR